MILERIVLENFRQFKGAQDIVLSDVRGRNVTVVHAENGSGKTTILNALLWGLYGHEGLTADFGQHASIIHEESAHRCGDPESLAAAVTIIFKHGVDERYLLTRRLTLAQQNADSTKTELVLKVMKQGQTLSVPRPQQKIQEIVPSGISAFLFFNGERIDYLAEERHRGKVTEAIHQMLGLKLLGTAINDLESKSVRGRLRQDLKEHTSDEKREALDELSSLEAISDHRDEEFAQANVNLKGLEAELAAVDAKLVANKAAYELQTKRERLTKEIKELRARCDDVTQRLAKSIGEDSYAILLGEKPSVPMIGETPALSPLE